MAAHSLCGGEAQKLKSVTRAGLPLRLAWALTIYKSQGITAREGCIVSFGGFRASSVAKLGLAFVAWTRAERWSRQGFYKLPPLGDFLSARLGREFEARSVFEHKADALFASLLSRMGHLARCPSGRARAASGSRDLRKRGAEAL